MNSAESSLLELCEKGKIDELLKSYIELCATVEDHSDTRSDVTTDEKKKGRKPSTRQLFPNLAGFCRYLGIGTQELERILGEFPDEYDRILAVLEDEALNSGISATLLSAYLKKRLGYDATSKSQGTSAQLEICFEHDIMEDGA